MRTRLFARGTGWLRWAVDEREIWEYEADAHASHVVGIHVIVPPLRRVWWLICSWLTLPFRCVRYRRSWGSWLSWEEIGPQSWDDLRYYTPAEDERYSRYEAARGRYWT